MKIFGDLKSGNCLKVKWTADHLLLSYDWIDVDVMRSETRTAAFLAMNPAGQVPTVILDDGRPLAQSNAIILHLARGSHLIPADAYDQAQMMAWLFWEQYSHEPYVAVARFQVRYQGRAVADLDAKLVERGAAALQRLEDGLSGGDFLVGPDLSLADVALCAYTRMAPDAGFDLAAYRRLQGWVARVETLLGIGAYGG